MEILSGDAKSVLVTDFFGSVRPAEIVESPPQYKTIDDLFDRNMFTVYHEELEIRSREESRKNVEKIEKISEQVNMIERKKTDDGIWFAVLVFGGLLIYIGVSAYEINSRHKTASFEFIPHGLVSATCFSPDQ